MNTYANAYAVHKSIYTSRTVFALRVSLYVQVLFCSIQDANFIQVRKNMFKILSLLSRRLPYNVCNSALYICTCTYALRLFSSPVPKAQLGELLPSIFVVRRPLSVVRRPSCVTFTISSSNSPEPFGGFQPNLVGMLFIWGWWVQQGSRGGGPDGKKGQSLKIFFSTTKSSRVIICCM